MGKYEPVDEKVISELEQFSVALRETLIPAIELVVIGTKNFAVTFDTQITPVLKQLAPVLEQAHKSIEKTKATDD